ncbi:MAG: DUF309 domain-containing protein [Polyangiaceae bacterium]
MTSGVTFSSHPLIMHETFQQGLTAYERGAYYDAHEHWELLWRDEPEGDRRNFLQGLILVAAALHKLGAMKSQTGSMRLFERARARLSAVPSSYAGVDVTRVLAGVDLALAALPKLHAEGRTDIDPVFVPRIGPAPN